MSESNFWRKLKQALAKDFFTERRTEMGRGGVPDVLLQLKGTSRCAQIELKYAPDGVSAAIDQKTWVRVDQAAYLCKWARNGGTGLVLAQLNEHTYLWYEAFGSQEWARQMVRGVAPCTQFQSTEAVVECLVNHLRRSP